jgi:osmoprotectant transport system permease protein
MNLFLEALAWMFSPERLVGESSIPNRLAEHLVYTLVSVLIAAVIAIPAGLLIGHTGRGRQLAIGLSGAARALPSLGLITILALLLGSIEFTPVLIVLVVLAVPSILAGAYAGVEAIDRHTIDAARAMGMTEWQVLIRVELPLGLPLLVGGLRNATLQVVATATLAAYIGLGGLGRYIFSGLSTRSFEVMLGGAILVAVLALLLEGMFALLQRMTRAPALRRH